VFESRGWALTYADVAATVAIVLAIGAIVLALLTRSQQPGPVAEAPVPAEAPGKGKGAKELTRIKFIALEPVAEQPIAKVAGMKLIGWCDVRETGDGIFTVTEQIVVSSKEEAVANTSFITDDSNSEAPHVRGASVPAGQTFSLFQGDGPPFVSATGNTSTSAEGQLVYNTATTTITLPYHAYVQARPDGGACEFFGTAATTE
jgi:hypothetical protein